MLRLCPRGLKPSRYDVCESPACDSCPRGVKPSRYDALRVGVAMLVALATLAVPQARAVSAAAAPAAAQSGRADVLVSAATSLTDVLQQLSKIHQSRSADRIVVNVGASNVLARQIAAGARVDVFISADEAQMDAVAEEIVPGTRVDLVANQLAVAVPDDRPRRFRSIQDLADPSIRRIAIGDPAAVPAGVYAKAYLQQAGVWPLISARVVPSGTVRLALAAVENGAADAAVVYRTDLATASRARTAFLVPPAEGPRIRYPAAILRSAPNPAGAGRLLAFLRSPDAAAVFEQAGFVPLQPGLR